MSRDGRERAAGRTAGAAERALGARGPSPLQEIEDERFARHGVRLLLKRDDLLHPEIPGNKWRKLVPNLDAALAGGRAPALLTFGGAWSHHLRATAAAGRLLGLATIGVVRGEELARRPLNDSLARCAADGMRLHFVSRAAYRDRHRPGFAGRLRAELAPDEEVYVVPEGGSNAPAVHGCAALGRELDAASPPLRPHVAAVPCGTGGTLAGLAAGLGPDQSALGIPVLRGHFLAAEVSRLQREAYGAPRGDWRLDERFHHGGYARTPPELTGFAEDFAARHGVPVPEPVYVAKLLWALTALTAEGAFPRGTVLAAVITG
ncbi:1-aminocyclopropane-1-carboxylate deaminase/D-cysteine desulfhydrase [Streptomyces sp. YIM 98790]|uniref:1-aminocyclopropane-1-carboxylate deaminase/D-cysteine desulfhydrase n=1 Tax=Streptomyces sp. YIM 98790 TaxID=2689077 RepID=UPI0014091D5F|nr:pyridoxal-phosphate dependent enzyme [Streptomyces sp. YIM 98790]